VSLDVIDLGVVIDGRPIVEATTLHVTSRSTLSVMGVNGSGKSTLLRAIAGLTAPATGRVLISGRDVTNEPTFRRNIGFVFQDLALFPHLDVAGNIAYGLRMRGIARAERRARVAELLELVRLPGFGAREIGSLSGGERQRVAIARALAPRPDLLLLDEPFAAVDEATKLALIRDIALILKREAITCLHVTHDADEPDLLGASGIVRLERPASPPGHTS
jgi:ABC-type Fe3+/spermidine/putrescine transport system ATPase subunit